MPDITKEWSEYERSKDYNKKLKIYQTNDLNERMYAGDQWSGVVANGLPTPVFNIFKRCINYFISAIMSQNIKMRINAENVPDIDPETGEKTALAEVADMLSGYSQTWWEKVKMNALLPEALLNAAISGDADGYLFWDEKVDTGQQVEAEIPGMEKIIETVMGDVGIEVIDNVNVFFGNPNDRRVEPQPWIIISHRALVSKLREEYIRYINEHEDQFEDKNKSLLKVKEIVGDTDYMEQAGDLGKIELEGNDENDGKAIALIKFWKKETVDENGKPKTTVWWKKSTRTVEIIPESELGTTRYPIPHMNWDIRKNSYHGQAIGTGLVPNQLFINKLFAMVMLSMMNTAFPKVIFNSDLISAWTNQVGEAIPVSGAEDINKVARYLDGGNFSGAVIQVIDLTIRWTKDLIGVTDVATGSGTTNPQNYAATIAVQQASMIPLDTIKRNLYQWVEDIGYIWLDFVIAKYGTRQITVNRNGQREVVTFNFDELKDVKFNLKIDVGPSSYWSEITSMQILDNMLEQEHIQFIQYLERLPEGMIPKKQELIDEVKASMDEEQLTGLLMQYIQQLEQQLSQITGQTPQPPEELLAMLEQGQQQPA